MSFQKNMMSSLAKSVVYSVKIVNGSVIFHKHSIFEVTKTSSLIRSTSLVLDRHFAQSKHLFLLCVCVCVF